MQYAAMQSLFDSLCQCLGQTPPVPREGDLPLGTDAYRHQRRNSDPTAGTARTYATGTAAEEAAMMEAGDRSPATRRASRLALKDKQWDALFESVQGGPNNKLLAHQHGSTPSSSPDSSPASHRGSSGGLETAQVLAQAKQAANPSRYRMSVDKSPTQADQPPSPKQHQRDSMPSSRSSKDRSHKRKRPTRDDIFRSKKTTPSRRGACEGAAANCMNPISKFLSNHQGFANALCFATPVRDSEEENDDVFNHNDNQSLASDANTLNTCEDSMMLLDQKLARMSKNQPPMPLFHQFKVNQNEPEELRRIVATDSHSSIKLMRLWKNQHNAGVDPPEGPSTSSSSSGPPEEGPPAMKKASSSSSDTCPSTPSSHRSYPQNCGEI